MTFEGFYLAQHAAPRTKLLHALGSGLVLACCLAEPRLLLAAGWASAAGLLVFRLTLGLEHGLLELAAALLAALAAGRAARACARPALHVLALGYGFAWYAHHFVEGNRPATFVYPTFSLWADFRMLAEILVGRHAVL